MHSWYFAYGSNMLKAQMTARTGSVGHPDHAPRIARLANYQLVFQRWRTEGQAFANIASPGGGVTGVIYRCSEADLAALDRYEVGYHRLNVAVSDLLGNDLAAVAYIVRSELLATHGNPRPEYLAKIVTGAREHGISEQDISQIVATASAVGPG